MTTKRIYLSSPHMSGLEQLYVQKAFAANWIAPLGPIWTPSSRSRLLPADGYYRV